MKKAKISKKTIIVIVLSMLLVAGIITTTVLLVEFRKLATPTVQIKFKESPYNVIEVSWKHRESNVFLVEYFYEIDEFEKQTLIVEAKKIELPRKRGLFQVKVQALANKERQNSKFSKLGELYIEPLFLQAPTFDLELDGNTVYIKNFEPSFYETESGVSEKVPFYQIKDSINPSVTEFSLGEITDPSDPYFINIPEFLEDNYYTVYVRAINYLEIYTEEIKEGELYFWHETSEWFQKTINLD